MISDARKAKALGDAFRNQKINVSRVVSSPWCRCVDTARLMAVGNVETSMSLLPDRDPANPVRRAELKEMISSWRGPGTLVLLTHGFTIQALFGFVPASAETIVVKPRQAASAGGDLVGRIATPQAQPSSLFIEDLTWPEVRDAIAKGKTTAIYYAGSTEQNGPHMALGKHNFVARYVAGRIAEALGNALAIQYSRSRLPATRREKPGTMRFPGSVTAVECHVRRGSHAKSPLSAISAGFRNVVLMGDHGGGQDALKQVAAELDRQWSAKGAHVHYVGDCISNRSNRRASI
jgi:hypothetical protein